MADARIEQLADILVDYSTKITKGDEVQLLTTAPLGLPLFRAVYRRVIERGAHVYTHIGFEDQQEIFFKHASDEQLRRLPELLYEETKRATAYIRLDAGLNSRTLSAIDPAKTTLWNKTIEPIFSERINNTRWVCTRIPNEGVALEAGMSLGDYEDFYYGACLLDWNEQAKKMKGIAAVLDAAKTLRVVTADTDLTVSVAGRPAVSCCGECNMPDGEIYLAPIETETQGHILFTFPARAGGNEIEDIYLEFKGGRVVKATASKGQDKLDKELATDDDAKLIGEFAFGVNYSIQKFTNNMLFDEKVGGTMHIALGRAYADSGGLSKSAIHWDIVKDLRDDGQVFADGKLVFEKGKWLVG
ncbi:MAG: aminopeptidase [Verrucomicrobia bacterium]|nr:aminopeptidase [Verrucomicrobiota bacterium]